MRRMLAVAAVLLIGFGAAACGEDGGSGGAAAEPAAEPDSGGPQISIVRSRSYCQQDVVLGNMDIVVTLRNTGDEAATVSVTPARYYDDGTDNKSPLDTFELKVPAGGQKGGYITVDTDDDHLLVRCALILDGGPERPIKARVS